MRWYRVLMALILCLLFRLESDLHVFLVNREQKAQCYVPKRRIVAEKDRLVHARASPVPPYFDMLEIFCRP